MDKYDWLEQTVSALIREHILIFDTAVDITDRDAAIEMFTMVYRNIQQNAQLYASILKNADMRLLRDRFSGILMEHYRQENGPGAVLSPEQELAIHFVSSTTASVIEWWFRNDFSLSPERLAETTYYLRFG